MTAAPQQQTLDLGDYRGQNITDTAVKILNQTGGFHPQTDMAEPEIKEMDEEFTIAVRVKVTDHHIKRILAHKDDEEDRLQLLQTWTMGTVAVIPDTGTVKKELDATEARRAATEKAAEKAKATVKKATKPARGPRGAGKLVSIGDSLQEAANAGKIPGVPK
jgi:hypothetical protein